MLYRVLSFALLCSLLLTTCKDDPTTGDLDVVFTATYDDEPLVFLAETYTYPSGVDMQFQLVNYFVSNVTLVHANSSEDHLLSDVELLNFDDLYDRAAAQAGLTRTYTAIPPGEYVGIRIGLGLSPELNATQPGDYNASHPLAENYWSIAKGYIFSKVEGVADLDGDSNFETGLTYHTGKSDLYLEKTFNTAISIKAGEASAAQVVLDVAKILESGTGEFLDISQPTNTIDHSVKPEVYTFLWENFTNAFTVTQ